MTHCLDSSLEMQKSQLAQFQISRQPQQAQAGTAQPLTPDSGEEEGLR